MRIMQLLTFSSAFSIAAVGSFILCATLHDFALVFLLAGIGLTSFAVVFYFLLALTVFETSRTQSRS